jgi:hypothetical protein
MATVSSGLFWRIKPSFYRNKRIKILRIWWFLAISLCANGIVVACHANRFDNWLA